ncbi:helix-turn-helix transcriptional regulator [Streptomyces sp. NPDC045714]|uniref:helix-turn-helix domain-containing protein n=1 Tax=Streptomyces sp. NPDC045714 TaxID=3154913 RepID=UPI0033C90179
MSSGSPQEIGRRIAACRRARRLTQTAIAAASHVSYAMVRTIERGGRRPSDEVGSHRRVRRDSGRTDA